MNRGTSLCALLFTVVTGAGNAWGQIDPAASTESAAAKAGRAASQVVQLQHSSADDAIDILQQLKMINDDLAAAGSPSANAVILRGTPSAIAEAAALLKELQASSAKKPTASANIDRLKTDLLDLQIRRMDRAKELGANHPAVRSLEAQIETLKKVLPTAQAAASVDKPPAEVSSQQLQKPIQELDTALAHAEAEAMRVATEIRRTANQGGNARKMALLKDELKAAVQSAFESRIELQQSQLKAAEVDLRRAARRLLQRQRLGPRIVQRRIDDLQSSAGSSRDVEQDSAKTITPPADAVAQQPELDVAKLLAVVPRTKKHRELLQALPPLVPSECKLEPMDATARLWMLKDSNGQPLRAFYDVNRDQTIDRWVFYIHGVQLASDLDSDFDGTADQTIEPPQRHGVESRLQAFALDELSLVGIRKLDSGKRSATISMPGKQFFIVKVGDAIGPCGIVFAIGDQSVIVRETVVSPEGRRDFAFTTLVLVKNAANNAAGVTHASNKKPDNDIAKVLLSSKAKLATEYAELEKEYEEFRKNTPLLMDKQAFDKSKQRLGQLLLTLVELETERTSIKSRQATVELLKQRAVKKPGDQQEVDLEFKSLLPKELKKGASFDDAIAYWDLALKKFAAKNDEVSASIKKLELELKLRAKEMANNEAFLRRIERHQTLMDRIDQQINKLDLHQPQKTVVSDAGVIGTFPPAKAAAGIVETARLSHQNLKAVCSVVDSPDGKHLYAAARDAHAISVYGRETEHGPPTKLLQTVFADEPNDLDGVLGLRVTPDGKYLVTTSFRSKTVTLFQRDADTGLLTRRDVARDGVNGVIGLHWAFDCEISPDSKFVYVTNSVSARAGSVLPATGDGHITVFRISNNKLQWVETHTGRNDCFDGATHIAIHPSGEWLYTANSSSNAIVVLKRDPESGRVTIQQILRDNDLLCLDGVFSVACSPDGNHLYASSGGFRGEHGVSAFRIATDDDVQTPGLQLGSLSPLQVHRGGGGNLGDFAGGNRVLVSPDGKNVYAMASLTGVLATFDRDAVSGRLTNTQSLRITPDDGSSGPAGMDISADGKFIFTGAQDHSSVIVLSRQRL